MYTCLLKRMKSTAIKGLEEPLSSKGTQPHNEDNEDKYMCSVTTISEI